jgi:aminobenzoyl-glutamate utilization protein B
MTKHWMLAALAACLTLAPLTAASGQSAPRSVDALKREGFAQVDASADRIARINDALYSYAEIGFQEFKTVELLTRELSNAGFTIQRNVAGMPTAFVARYGQGSPVIGLMADFDGVPGASQRPTSLAHDPQVNGAPGHGEGHNIGQPTLLAAAIALKSLKNKHALPGTIVIYGGPAEELLASRGYMVNAGVFADADAIVDVHIGTSFSTSYGLSNLAILSAQWTFTGLQAHGARAWEGRSALDAVEIMNISTDFMREHVDPAARIHHVIPDGGQQPNVVPGEATTWYYFRHLSAAQVWALFKRAREAAKGAALATDTTVTERILSASWPFNGNQALAKVVQSNIELVGMPKWSAADQAFARAYQKSMGAPVVGMPTEVEPLRQASQASGSTDAGDVTWQAPFVRLRVPAKPDGELAGHHWSAGVAPATPLAHNGISAGAKVLVGAALDLMTSPETVAAIKADFAAQLARYPKWKSMIPPDAEPPIHLNTAEMGRYREALKPYEYNPKSKQTYLQFMKVAYPPAEPAGAVGLQSNEPGTSE